MKPEIATPDASVVETTIRKRTIPSVEPLDTKTTDLWEYLRSLSASEWAKHMVYVYRTEPGPQVGILKCSEQYVQMPDGHQVLIGDEQEMDFAIQQNFGGGTFRVLVKRGAQIVRAANIAINAQPRAIAIPVTDRSSQGAAGSATVGPMTEASATAQVAGRAMDALTLQERQSAEIGFAAMRTGAEALERAANLSKNATPQDDLQRAFMQAMIQRMTMDPMEQLRNMLVIMKELGSATGSNGGGGPLVEKLLGAAVERFMNPAPSGAPVSASAELVHILPQIGSTVAESLTQFRLAREAELRMLQLQRGAPSTPQPPLLAATPASPAAAPAPTNGAPSMEFVDQKLIGILQQPVSAEQAADDAMTFLSALDPKAVPQLAMLGEAGLVALFQRRPILKQATNNMPRLVEFIRAFLRMHAEDVAADAGGQAEPPKPVLPN